MKKQLLTFGVILLLMFGAVAAQTQTTKQTAKDPGITPDSFWWKLDVLFDNIEEMISFSEKAKVESRLEHAQERLAELQAMAAEQKIDAMAKAEQEHGKTLTKLEEDLQELEDGDSEEQLKLELEIKQEIHEHEENIGKFADEFADELNVSKSKEQITPEQQALIDSILANLKSQIGKVTIEIENETSKTKIKIEQETGKSGNKIEIELENEEEPEKAEEDKEKEGKDKDETGEKLSEILSQSRKENSGEGSRTETRMQARSSNPEENEEDYDGRNDSDND